MGNKKNKGFYRAVLELKELGVWGSFGRVPERGGCFPPKTSGLPDECGSRLRHLLGLPDGFNLLDGTLVSRLASAVTGSLQRVRLYH